MTPVIKSLCCRSALANTAVVVYTRNTLMNARSKVNTPNAHSIKGLKQKQPKCVNLSTNKAQILS